MFLSIIFWVIFADLSMLFQSKEEGKDQESIQSSTVKPVYNNHSQRDQNDFKDQLCLSAGQKYRRTVQGEHSAILSTCIKLPFVIKIFVLSILE